MGWFYTAVTWHIGKQHGVCPSPSDLVYYPPDRPCTHTLHLLYPSIYWCILRLFPYLVYNAMDIEAHISFQISVFILDMEKAMAPHFSTLAWKIPWTEEPDRLQSMGSWGVGHNWTTSLSLFTFMHWRRKWQPTPVFWPGESQGWGSLVGCCLWGCTESDMTEAN